MTTKTKKPGQHNARWMQFRVVPYLHAKIGNAVFTLTVDEAAARYREEREKVRVKRRAQKAARKRNRR